MRPVSVKPGDVFERLAVVSVGPVRKTDAGKYRSRIAACVCVCGRATSVPISSLTSGNTKSCGCLLADSAKARSTRHGMHKTKAYWVWSAMVQRCTNPKNPGYKNYGGRGIKIDPEWLQFENFFADMGEPPPGMSLDREDNDSVYSKNNCRWADRTTQSRNQRAMQGSESGVRGVARCTQTGKWKVRIRAEGTSYWGGRFDNLDDAIARRIELENKHWRDHGTDTCC